MEAKENIGKRVERQTAQFGLEETRSHGGGRNGKDFSTTCPQKK